jgi:hypothetical protein
MRRFWSKPERGASGEFVPRPQGRAPALQGSGDIDSAERGGDGALLSLSALSFWFAGFSDASGDST